MSPETYVAIALFLAVLFALPGRRSRRRPRMSEAETRRLTAGVTLAYNEQEL
jgi:hypothetical protein